MPYNDHNQAQAIAALLCPLLRSRSPEVPYRSLVNNDHPMLLFTIKHIRALGVRKRFFQSTRSYVTESLLFIERCFETMQPAIELRATSPVKGAWRGGGEFKETTANDILLLDSALRASGMAPMGPDAFVEIDVSAIWRQVSPYLESVDAAERVAERQRKQMVALEHAPKYEGPPATPEQAAEIKRIITEIQTGKKSDPNYRDA